MERFKKIAGKLLVLPGWLTALFGIGAGCALVWVFLEGHDTRWFAYPIYVLAFYALTVTCVWLAPRAAGLAKRRKAENTDGAARAKKLKEHMLRHLAVSLVYGLGQTIQGVIAGSAWIGGNGLYNMCCGIIHAVLLWYERRLRRDPEGDRHRRMAWKCYTVCGFLMAGVNLTMTGLAFQMIWMGRSGSYSEIMVIAVAAFTFYKLIMAVIRVFRCRNNNEPIPGAVRNLGLAEALMSLFSLQTALFAVYGTEAEMQFLMNSLTGFAVCLMTMLGSIGMVMHGRRRLRQIQGEEQHGTERDL